MTGVETSRNRLGRYEIEAELGRGTMGVVYRAYDPDLGRHVALKTIHAALGQVGEERAAFEARFAREARAAAGLAHPGIVVVHDVGRDPATSVLFMALEYLEGRTLAALAAGGTPLAWREALRLCARVAEALHHAHERGVVHRDVKPANIMVLPSGEPKVMDFGIAHVDNAQLTTPGEALGTPLYMSPEQARGEPLDARSDVFSLGAVLYLLLTGRNAFAGPNLPAILARVAQAVPVPPSQIAEVPADVDSVVARALAKDAAERYPDARSFAEDLDDLRAGHPPRHRTDWVSATASHPLEDLVGLDPPAVTVSAAAHTARNDAVHTQIAAAPAPPSAGRSRAAAAAAVLAGVLAVAWLASRSSSPSDGTPPALSLPTLLRAPAPARLEVAFEHPLREGTLQVWAGDELMLEQALDSRVTGRVPLLKKRRGSVSEDIELPPGEHTLRVVVSSRDDRWSARITGEFEGGAARRLMARLGGGILGRGRELQLWWAAAPAEP